MRHKGLSAHEVERSCGISNGYLKKQYQGKGGMGSEMLEKLYREYPDLDLIWLITGRRDLNQNDNPVDYMLEEEHMPLKHSPGEELIALRRQLKLLEEMNSDKEKIIMLLEKDRQHHRK